jgi:hypothetical protein
MSVEKFTADTDGDAITPDVGVRGKGTANAALGQVVLGPGITKTAVFGASNIKAIYIKKKVGNKWEYEACSYEKLGDALTTGGYKLASAKTNVSRSFDLTAAAAGLSRKLFCKVESGCTVGWSQANTVYSRVTDAARNHFGQTATPANAKEVVYGANYFVFATVWNGIPAGTLLSKEALKATVRYADATASNSGVYRSYCQETPPAIP